MGSATHAGRSLPDRSCDEIEDPGRAAGGVDTLVEGPRGLFLLVRRC